MKRGKDNRRHQARQAADRFLSERERILKEIDVDAAVATLIRPLLPAADPRTPEQLRPLAEASIHKARFINPAMTAEEREISRRWLIKEGLTQIGGAPIPTEPVIQL